MILLLSCDGDMSCDLVIDWQNLYNHKYIRINSFDIFSKSIEIIVKNQNVLFKIEEQQIPINEIKVIWYRKFGFFEDSYFHKKLLENFAIENTKHIAKEYYKILNFILLILKNKQWVTNPFKSNLNKIEVLRIANKCGFDVPQSYILNKLVRLDKNEKYIVKSIVDPIIAENIITDV